ncbi:MAG: hypothetical protein FWG40_00745 [Peptococcaceae bacterium]|nr:hypothetical protein [Peptococcaceae bacterium]
MISLLALLSIVGLVVCFVLFFRTDSYTDEKCFCGAGIFVTIVLTLVLCYESCLLAYKVKTAYTISQEIEMYQSENANIESNIDAAVEVYMQHEKDTFGELKPSAITLATIYPELKSNELVQQQIQLHMDNNQKIKDLKTREIGVSRLRWLLYFGK